MNEGWIKVHRKLLDSDMYRCMNGKQRSIFLEILLCANHEEREWWFEGKVYKVKPGEFVTSLASLKAKCAKDVSIQNIRTCLLYLEEWHFLTNQSTSRNRLITICNWGKYQEPSTSKPTNNQQTINKQLTTNKNEKNEKNEKNTNPPTPRGGVASATGNESEFLYWTKLTGTTIRTKYDENIKAAHRLKERLGNNQFARAVETIRIVRADSHAGRFLHVIGNYIQLEKNIEAIEAYRQGIDDRPTFENNVNNRLSPEERTFLGIT